MNPTTGDFVAWAETENEAVRSGIVLSVGSDGVLAAVLLPDGRIVFPSLSSLRSTVKEAEADMRAQQPVPAQPVPAPSRKTAECKHPNRVPNTTGWECKDCGWLEFYA